MARYRQIFRLLPLLILAIPCHASDLPLAASIWADKVIVLKSERKLMLVKKGEVLKIYRIALGGDPVGPKTRQGDHKTPEGSYVLDSRNPNSHFYKAFHISYPDSKDIAAARKAGAKPGGDIMLHGLPKQYAWV